MSKMRDAKKQLGEYSDGYTLKITTTLETEIEGPLWFCIKSENVNSICSYVSGADGDID